MKEILLPILVKDPGKVSDGYHTFDELYHHRNLLFIHLLHSCSEDAFRSTKHSDGEDVWKGWFVAGLETPEGQITYHLPATLWHLLDGIPTPEKAPKWDGHTSDDVAHRLTRWLLLAYSPPEKD